MGHVTSVSKRNGHVTFSFAKYGHMTNRFGLFGLSLSLSLSLSLFERVSTCPDGILNDVCTCTLYDVLYVRFKFENILCLPLRNTFTTGNLKGK
jgi:hypothetical protein